MRKKRANLENELINCNICVYAEEDEGCLSVRWTERDTHFQNHFPVQKTDRNTEGGNGKSG